MEACMNNTIHTKYSYYNPTFEGRIPNIKKEKLKKFLNNQSTHIFVQGVLWTLNASHHNIENPIQILSTKFCIDFAEAIAKKVLYKKDPTLKHEAFNIFSYINAIGTGIVNKVNKISKK